MTRAFIVTGFAFAVAVTPARAQSVHAQDLIGIALDLTEMCQGMRVDDPHSDEVCNERLKVDELLGKLGYCADRPYHWGRCARNR
jgi:hypothetical protein